jgi:hypothetical protein
MASIRPVSARPDELVQLLPWHWHSEQLVAAVPQKVHLTLREWQGDWQNEHGSAGPYL